MHHIHWIANVLFVTDLAIRVALAVRVIKRRLPVGVSLAWLGIILIFPFMGVILYLMIGEYRLGRRRARRTAAYQEANRTRISKLRQADRMDPAQLAPEDAAVARLAETRAPKPASMRSSTSC
jgi:cardiolipin synthase